jgi:hypothetical protein
MSPHDDGEAVARQLVALAHEELSLVENGQHDALADLGDRRAAVQARLPKRLSPTACVVLDEVVDVQRRTAAELTMRMALVREEMSRLRQGRTAMAGYTPAGYDARPVLDRTA